MKRLLTLLSILICISGYAQQDTIYLNKDGDSCAVNDAAFHVVFSPETDTLIPYALYKKDGILVSSGFTSRKGELVMNGHQKYYYEDGSVEEEGVCYNNIRIGEWKHYRRTSGKLMFTENYFLGKRVGQLVGYYSSGAVKTREHHMPDGTVTGRTFDEKGKEIRYEQYIQVPVCKLNVAKFLSRNLEYPEYCVAKNIAGRVEIAILIDDTGDMILATVIKSAHPMLDEEALRVVRLLREWQPGKVDGKPQKMYMTQPITFKL
ncbi:MAG: TonB family protein [Flavipsychrobacter sp.]|nr:TonB family protein [Flavipsychrobacter sp.]